MKEGKYSLGAFLWRVFLSVILVSGPFWALWFLYKAFWDSRAYDSRYELKAIVQTGFEKEALKTAYISEVLGFSKDNPQNIYRLDLTALENKLLGSPLISSAHIKRIPPGALYIDYKIRKPIAYLADRTNAALDEEGYVIPFKPFFTPKKIARVYLGLNPSTELVWNQKLEDKRLNLAWNLLNQLKCLEGIWIKNIDLSRAEAESLGERRIVLVLDAVTDEGERVERCVVLNSEDPLEGVERFCRFRTEAKEWEKEKHLVLDLRVPELGLIKKRKG